MLKITNTVTNKDAQVVVDKTTYAVHYTIVNEVITSVQCSISQEENGLFDQIGFIRLEGDRLSTDFKKDAALIDHLTVFESITEQIDTEVNQE